jgi:hypothetical protein
MRFRTHLLSRILVLASSSISLRAQSITSNLPKCHPDRSAAKWRDLLLHHQRTPNLRCPIDRPYNRTLLNRRAFAITDTELKLIAAAATIGLNSHPSSGYTTPAASGTPAAL